MSSEIQIKLVTDQAMYIFDRLAKLVIKFYSTLTDQDLLHLEQYCIDSPIKDQDISINSKTLTEFAEKCIEQERKSTIEFIQLALEKLPLSVTESITGLNLEQGSKSLICNNTLLDKIEELFQPKDLIDSLYQDPSLLNKYTGQDNDESNEIDESNDGDESNSDLNSIDKPQILQVIDLFEYIIRQLQWQS